MEPLLRNLREIYRTSLELQSFAVYSKQGEWRCDVSDLGSSILPPRRYLLRPYAFIRYHRRSVQTIQGCLPHDRELDHNRLDCLELFADET